jgi:hypothetical protein
MKANPMPNVKEVFQTAVKHRINGDRKHGWGVDDSQAVIIALIADETGGDVKDIEANKEFCAALKEVINPSQFRQKLESAKILDKAPTREQRVDNLLADFN